MTEETHEGPLPGDLVIVPFADAREGMGLPAEAGLVLEDRRHVLKVWFPSLARSLWLEREILETVQPRQLPVDPLALRLHRIARRAHAEWIEIEDLTPERVLVQVYSRGMRYAHVRAVRRLLGDDLQEFRLTPANVRWIRLRLQWRR